MQTMKAMTRIWRGIDEKEKVKYDYGFDERNHIFVTQCLNECLWIVVHHLNITKQKGN